MRSFALPAECTFSEGERQRERGRVGWREREKKREREGGREREREREKEHGGVPSRTLGGWPAQIFGMRV